MPEVHIVRLENVGELLGDPGNVVAAVVATLDGAVSGRTLQVVPGPTAALLTALLLESEARPFPDGFGSLERSALEEIGGALVDAYLNALSELTGLGLRQSAAAIAVDMSAAVLTTSCLNLGSQDDHVFCVHTRLGVETGGDLPAYFLLMPDQVSLHTILSALSIA